MRRDAKIKLIIVAVIFLLIIVMSLIINVYQLYSEKKGNTTSNNNTNNVSVPQENPAVLYTDTSIKKVETMSLLLATQQTINTYFDYIHSDNATGIMSILDSDYITNNNLSSANVVGKLNTSNEKLSFFVTKAYVKEISFDHEYKYWVYGKSYTNNFVQNSEEQFIVNLDMYNHTFKILPIGQTTEQNYDKFIDELIHTDNGSVASPNGNITSIQANNYNKFSIYESNEGIKNTIENYAKYYYFMEKNNSKAAFNLLDEEYKLKRFNNDIDAYLASPLMWKSIKVAYVKQTEKDGKKQYIGIDENGSYYIFSENEPMDYKVMLDSYTVPLEETINNYNKASNIEKACLCIKTIEEMVNIGDYSTAYARMNNIFKKNNFPTQNDFEKYITDNYYAVNKFKFESYEYSDECFIVKVTIANGNNEEETFEAQYVVKLNKDITDFEYSISI